MTAVTSPTLKRRTDLKRDRRCLVDCYLDELLSQINDFFHDVPDEFKPDVYREYWAVCSARLEART